MNIENHVHDFIYFDTSHPSKLMVQKKAENTSVGRRRSLTLMDNSHREDSFLEKETVKGGNSIQNNKNKLSIIKPKIRIGSSEEIE